MTTGNGVCGSNQGESDSDTDLGVLEILKPFWLTVIYLLIPSLLLTCLWLRFANVKVSTSFAVEIGELITLFGLLTTLLAIQKTLVRFHHIRFALAMSPFFLSMMSALSVKSIRSPFRFLWQFFREVPVLSAVRMGFFSISVFVVVTFILLSMVALAVFYGANRRGWMSTDRDSSVKRAVLLDGLVLWVGGWAFISFHGLIFWFWDFRDGGGINIVEKDIYTMGLILLLHLVFTLLVGSTVWLYRNTLETARKETVALCATYYVAFLPSTPLFKSDGPLFQEDFLVIAYEYVGRFLWPWDPVLFVLVLLNLILFVQIVFPIFLFFIGIARHAVWVDSRRR